MLNRLNELYHYNRSRLASVDILFCEGWHLLCDRKNLKVDLHGHLYPCVRHLWLVQGLSFKVHIKWFSVPVWFGSIFTNPVTYCMCYYVIVTLTNVF